MNSTLLKILAVLLAVGALLMGWSGYRLSMKSAQAMQHKAPPPTYPQVVAARDILAGKPLEPADLEVVKQPLINPQGYAGTDAIVGRFTQVSVKQGAPLLKSHFPVLSTTAQALQPGERAVAVKVNEVVGVGGMLGPGDHVDVLLYLRADRETGNTSSSQVILRDTRVLAYGDNLEDAGQLPPASAKPPEGADVQKKRETKPEKDSRSAILAVPEKDVARLVLADSAGQLRLALRGAEPPRLVKNENIESHFMRLEELAKADMPAVGSAPPPMTKTALAVPLKAKRTAHAVPKQSTVVVHNGDRTEVVHVAD